MRKQEKSNEKNLSEHLQPVSCGKILNLRSLSCNLHRCKKFLIIRFSLISDYDYEVKTFDISPLAECRAKVHSVKETPRVQQCSVQELVK